MALVGGIVGLLGVVVVMSHPRRYEALTLLVGITGGLISVQFSNVHVFTAMVTIWWLVSPRRGVNRPPLLPLAIFASSVAVAVTALTGDLVNNPKLGLQLLALSLNACMIASRSTPSSQRNMLLGLLVTCTAGSFFGLGQVAGLFPVELWHLDISSFGRPPSFYPEPDWLGLFATLGIVLAWRLLSGPAFLRYLAIVVNSAASAMAFARAPWVGLAIAVALFALMSALARRQAPRRRGTLRTLVVVGVTGVTALAVTPGLASQLAGRLSTLGGHKAGDVSGQARIQQTDGMLALAHTSPPFGHGLSASGHVGVSGRYVSDAVNNVGSNWILSLWVDAHYLAIPLIMIVLALGLWWVRTVPGQLLLLVCVNNLFSNATFQPVTWMLLGATAALPAFTSVSPPERSTESSHDVQGAGPLGSTRLRA